MMKNPALRHLPAWLVLATAVFLLSGKASAQSGPASGEKLKFAIVLTRHGVRSPTWTNERLNEYSSEPWPKWPVAPGFLTPHGRLLMTQFGTYYHLSFAERGLLVLDGCADADKVFIRADTDERTLETGRALAKGLLPGCSVQVHSLGDGVPDALFHSRGDEAKTDGTVALAAVDGRIGADPAALLPAYDLQLHLMQQVLSGCTGVTCAPPSKKQLLAISPSIAAAAGDHLVELKGPLFTGATFAENFQLEYLEGMPSKQVGWGRVDEDTMRALMAMHAASSDILQRTPYIAQVQAFNMLGQVLKTLEQAEHHKSVAGAIGGPADKLVFLVGHDTNISNIAALLDAHWLVNGYQRDDAAPGGALVFELWEVAGGQDEIHVYYTVQTPQQMRNAEPLSLAAPPARAVIFLPACSHGGDHAPCDWSAFDSSVRNRLARAVDTSR